MRQNGTFPTGVHNEYKEIANAPNAHKIKPSKKRTASKAKWCSLHNTTSHNDAQGASSWEIFARLTSAANSRKGSQRQCRNPRKTSEEVTVSKDDLGSVMKRISTSLQEQDCNSSRQRGLYGFLIHSRPKANFINIYNKETVNTTMVEDSKGSEHSVDNKLVKGIEQLMFDCQ